MTATETARAVNAGRMTAEQTVRAALDRIARHDPALNAFTEVLSVRALARAVELDATPRKGRLAGVPFAVKNLFDVAWLSTRAGSRINRNRKQPPADATLIARLEREDAILVGTLNMGEYAYDFTGENSHDGPSRNPHDLARMSGGSSGGSASAVAGGLVPLSLGSDTNGSIRVPASFCGLFGLKPTYGGLSRAGTFPFVSSFDHVGPLARSVEDLMLSYNVMRGPDADDPVCASSEAAEWDWDLPAPGEERRGVFGRVGVATGHFRQGASPQALAAVDACAEALSAHDRFELPGAATARAAAYLITATEGAALHMGRLRTRPQDFDPAVRDRLIAGTLVPAALVTQAQKFRREYRRQVLQLFEDKGVAAILAPATPCTAPLIGQQTMRLDGVEVAVRPNLGIYTQPISFIGLPVVTVPVPNPGGLPIGVQIIARPWQERDALHLALQLERMGVAGAPRPAVAA